MTEPCLGGQCARERLEFSKIDGDNRACRGSSTSDNNPRNYIIASGQDYM